MTEPVPASVDLPALARWMDANGVPGTGELPLLRGLGGGSQNELTEVTRGAHRMVLRKPPANAVADRVEGIRREHRLVRALADSDVPHARYVAGSDDSDLLGMPFYVMEMVDGWSPSDLGGWAAPFDTDVAARRGLALELVRGAALLGRVDWQGRGLEGFGRPANFHERQVDRWLAFLERVRCRDLPGLEETAAWLRGHRPRHWSPGVMHGDCHFGNVMFAHGAPARLAAIIDWEMTTIGDPLLDLGWVLVAWPPDGDELPNVQMFDLAGMPTLEEMCAHYEQHSGRSTEDIVYYIVLARFKLGIVLEQSYSRLVAGVTVNPKVAAFGPIVTELISGAARLAGRHP